MSYIYVSYYLTQAAYDEKVSKATEGLAEAERLGHDGNRRYYKDELQRLANMTRFDVRSVHQ